MSSSPDEATRSSSEEKEPWWHTYGTYSPEKFERELRQFSISRHEAPPGKVFMRFSQGSPLTNSVRDYLLGKPWYDYGDLLCSLVPGVDPTQIQQGLCLMPTEVVESFIKPLIETFTREVPEETRLKYVEMWKDGKEKELLRNIASWEETIVKLSDFLSQRPLAEKFPSDSEWGHFASLNIGRARVFDHIKWFEENTLMSVPAEGLDMIENSARQQIIQCKELIALNERDLAAGREELWKCAQQYDSF